MKRKLAQHRKSAFLKPLEIVRCLMVLFFLCAAFTATHAQSITADPGQKPVRKVQPAKPDVVKPSPAPATVKAAQAPEKKNPVADLPFYNYKGISDLEQAKAAWIADNPEEYNKMLQQMAAESKAANLSLQNPQQSQVGAAGTSPGGQVITPKDIDDGSAPNVKPE